MKPPKLPSIFKQQQANSFGFKPRYYDESEERIKKLREKYARMEKAQSQRSPEANRALEEKFKKEWQNKRQSSVNSSNRTLLLIIVVLLFITYYIITF